MWSGRPCPHRQQVGLHYRVIPSPESNGGIALVVLVHRRMEPIHLRYTRIRQKRSTNTRTDEQRAIRQTDHEHTMI